jgi:holo-[acyl-carrier protein] synthase
MIFVIGTDIVEVSRIEDSLQRFGEAFAKALGTGLRGPATFQNIGVTHDDLGKPVLDLLPELQSILDQF